MASKATTSASFLLALNLLFFTLVSSTYTPYPPPPPPKCDPKPKPHTCPIDTLKLGVCAGLVHDLLHVVVGTPPSSPKCCSLIKGLVDLEVGVCLCTALKVGVLGINLINVPVDLSLLVNHCTGKKLPSGFQCP